jgi:predicted TPR repeat methyltransferase
MIQNNIGNIYQLSGQFDKAIACYQRALDSERNMPEVHNNLGNIYKNCGQFDEAEACYRRALVLSPDFVEVCCNLGGVLRSLKRFQEAIELYRKVLNLSPDYKAALEGLGICHMEINTVNWDADISRPGMEFLGPKNVREILEDLQLPRERGLEVLDMGCGTGICGEYLRAYSQHLEGVDLSQPMLAEAEKKGFYDKLECADAITYMLSCTRTFDLIIASGVLILFGDLAPVFQAVARALKPGGMFVFTLYRSETEAVEVRHNLHFAHSAVYVHGTAQGANLQLASIEQKVHEYDHGEQQPGWVAVLRKAV